MVSKGNPGRGSKDNKKATPKNGKRKTRTAAVSKQKKGRKGKDACATDLRVDQSWPPKPWIRKRRKRKAQCYANPETGQQYYTEADLERHLAYLARREAKEAEQLQAKAARISERKIESNEISEATTRCEGENLERTTQDEAAPEIAVGCASHEVEDLDYIFREIESREAAEACDGEVLPDNASPDLLSGFLMWDVESYMKSRRSP